VTLTNATTGKTFVTRELTTGENALQAGWAKSKSGLLDRLDVNGSRITIRRRNGAVDELQKGAFRCTSYRTGSGRRLFVIKADDGRKIRLMEMNGMLSAAEWDDIADEVLGAVPSDLNKIVTRAGLSIVIGMFAAALTAGFLAGLLGLTDEQVAFSSPLSLGLMAGWIVALWFGFKRLSAGTRTS
jgi:hypothetical protein